MTVDFYFHFSYIDVAFVCFIIMIRLLFTRILISLKRNQRFRLACFLVIFSIIIYSLSFIQPLTNPLFTSTARQVYFLQSDTRNFGDEIVANHSISIIHYAQIHGYHVLRYQMQSLCEGGCKGFQSLEIGNAWFKVLAIGLTLELVNPDDLVIFVDGDVSIFTESLHKKVEETSEWVSEFLHGDQSMMVCGDSGHWVMYCSYQQCVNSGIVIMKNNAWVRSFVRTWWQSMASKSPDEDRLQGTPYLGAEETFRTHWPWEQERLSWLYDSNTEFREHINITKSETPWNHGNQVDKFLWHNSKDSGTKRKHARTIGEEFVKNYECVVPTSPSTRLKTQTISLFEENFHVKFGTSSSTKEMIECNSTRGKEWFQHVREMMLNEIVRVEVSREQSSWFR